MAVNDSVTQNLLPVQAYFDLQGNFQTFIGQNKPFYASINPVQSGLTITNSTIDSTTIGATSPSTGVFTNVSATTGQISTTPSSNTDIANKFYVDTVAQGLGPKAACAVATTANITLSGLQTIDGYTTLAGDRVLVKNQSSSQYNGIYIASASTWTRSTDMDVWSEVPGAYTVILNGGQADQGWVCTASQTGTINVTAMPWVQFSGSATYFAGTGLTLASNTFSITNTGVTAATYGSASSVPVFAVNAQGQITSVTNTTIAIANTQVSGLGTMSTQNANSVAITGGSINGTTIGASTAAAITGTTITATSSFSGSGSGLTGTASALSIGGNAATATYATSAGSASTATTATTATNIAGGAANSIPYQSAASTTTFLASGTGVLQSNSGLSWTTAPTLTGTNFSSIPNSALTNSSITIGSTNIALGATASTLTSVTLATPTISSYETYTASSAPSYNAGRLWYDSTVNSLAYYNDVTNNTLHIGEEIQLKVYNNTGSTINIGQPVYVTSTSSGYTYPNVALAIANSLTTGNVIGLANQNIPTGTAGYVTTIGLIQGLNTGSYTVGDTLYLSPYSAGYYQNTIPPTGYAIKLGTVAYVNSSNGAIYINKSILSIQAGNIVGQVSLANGGTNANLTATAGGIAYSTSSALALTSAGTTGQVLTSNGTSAPTWTTPAGSVSLSDDTTTNATRYPLFANATSGSVTTEYTSSTKYQYNPSTGTLTASVFSGAGTGLTGTASSLSIGGNAATATSATSATTATNLAGGANGSVPYQTGSGATTFLAAGTNGYVLTLAGGVPTWASSSGGVTITDDTSTNGTRYLNFTSATSGSLSTIYTSSTELKWNPSLGILDLSGATGSVNLPKGTTAQRPASPITSMIRYNTTQSAYEVYTGSAWVPLATTAYSYSADYLVIAGGGNGGNFTSGGAGGMLTGTQTLTPGTVYTATVGAGGGNNSTITATSFTTITAIGGGNSGGNGGSGGGSSNNNSGGTGTAGQGNNGGMGVTDGLTYNSGGGGGGAGSAGGNSTGPAGHSGNGGSGLASSITGSSVTYAGGGGGGADSRAAITAGAAGSGGGGAGGSAGGNGGNGTANTGGGAGGAGYNGSSFGTGGTGGSGVIILSVPTANYTGTVTGSPTVTTSGSNTIIKFTSTGTYTA